MRRGGLMGGASPYGMLNAQVGNYYAGPSGAALGALVAGQAIGDAFRDLGAGAARRSERADAKAQQDRMYGLQEQQLQWQKDKVAQDDAHKRNVGRATIYMLQNPNPTPEQVAEYTSQWGHSPLETADHNSIAKFMEGRENRQMRLDIARENADLRRDVLSSRGTGGEKDYKPELFLSPQGQPVWIKPGEQVPQGFMPHTSKTGVTVNPDGTTTISTGGSLKSIPNAAVASLTSNFSTINRIDESLAAISDAPSATGYLKGVVNEFAPNMINRMDPEGAQARAALGDLGSTIIHDRSGAAVTASEYPRLRPFIPTAYDDAETAKMKLERFKQIVAEETRLYADNFGPDMGYKRPASWDKYLGGQSPSQNASAASDGNGSSDPLGLRGGK